MKVQLFNPPVHHYAGVHYQMNPPLGLPILSSVLRDAGHECEVVDLEALGIAPDTVRTVFESQSDKWPDWVGLTCLTSSVRGCRETIGAIKASGYDGKIVVGGPHATLFPQQPLEWGADRVVVGESEGNIVELLEWFTRIPGENGVYRGEPMDIKSIPAPDWKHHRPSPRIYQGNCPPLSHPEGISMWSRGCPHNCIYCGNPVFGQQKKRFRPPENIYGEMAGLKKTGIKSVFVYDDEMVGTPTPAGWLEAIAEQIGPLGLTWKTQGRCSQKHISRQIMELLYQAGCRVVMWGVESFSDAVLKAIQKGTTAADNWWALKAAKEVGIKNWVFTMIGNYGETDKDLSITAHALEQAYQQGLIDYRQTTIVTALPGTELWRRQHDEGWFVPTPEGGPQMHQVYQSTPWLSADRIAYWFRKFDEVCPKGAT